MIYLNIIILLFCMACASEHTKNRTFHQYMSPDKFRMQLHYNTDDYETDNGHDKVDQVRFGLDWNL